MVQADEKNVCILRKQQLTSTTVTKTNETTLNIIRVEKKHEGEENGRNFAKVKTRMKQLANVFLLDKA